MELAIEEARQSKQAGELPIGAVIRCKGKVIARAKKLSLLRVNENAGRLAAIAGAGPPVAAITATFRSTSSVVSAGSRSN